MRLSRSPILRYSAVVLNTVAAFALTSLLRSWHIPGIFPSFFAAVVLSSWIGGFGGGLLSTFLSSVAVCWFLPPVHAGVLHWNTVFSLVMFLLQTLFVAAVSTKLMSVDSVLSAALLSIQDAVVMADSRGRVTFLNKLAERLTGWQAEEARKVPVRQLLQLQRNAAEPVDPVAKVLGSGHAATLGEDIELRTRSGTSIAVEGSCSPIRDRAGRDRGAVVAFRDVTERRRSHEELELTTITLRALLNTAPVAIWTLDLEGKVTFWNPAAEHTFGWSEQEVTGRKLPVVPDDQEQEFTELLERYRQGEPLLGVERLRRRKDGTDVWTTIWAVPLRDAKGAVTGTLGLVVDITERRKAEAALLQSRAQLEMSQRLAHLGSWERDVASNELRWSEETYRIFGIPCGQRITLETFLQAVHPQDRERVRWTAQEALRTLQPYQVEHRIVRPDGAERVVAEQAEVVLDPQTGKAIRLNGAVQDITEHKRLEGQLRQAQKMEAVGRLAGSIAHDFNNLLTVISGYGELLVDSREGQARPREAAEEVVRAAKRAAELTRQLLAFSRRQLIEPQTLSLNRVVGGLERMLRRLIGEDVRLSTGLVEDLWLVNADIGQLEQVIMNLVVNARDAMSRGGTLTIETANVQLDTEYAAAHVEVKTGNYVLLAVSDTGCGMTPEIQARLFEPFFTTKEKGRGTGLGLSTVYGIVKQSGGHIGVYSEPGRGSTFKIYLPQAREVLAAPAVETTREQTALSPKTILVVEDEEAVRKLTLKILERGGHTVLAAANAAEALALTSQHQGNIHLLISDLVLPDMGGSDLATIFRKRAPGVPVLFMSGYSEQAAANQQVLTAGAEFLPKPFTPSSLLRKVQEVFGRGPA